MATYSIFGCGPAGLYTAWRLIISNKLSSTDTLHLYDWGKYRFQNEQDKAREPAGRICTYFYNNQPGNSYVEVGGMRYIQWDGTEKGSGHRLVSTLIKRLNLEGEVEPFNTTEDPLFYLRQKHFYSSQISSSAPAPYQADHCLATYPPDKCFSFLAKQALGNQCPNTRIKQCAFYQEGKVPKSMESEVFLQESPLKNIGYWNLMYDQLGSEGYQYASAGGGYTSNLINWNSADALIYNSEFAPGGEFKTLVSGYSSLFVKLMHEIFTLCVKKNITCEYHPHTKLRSIYINPQQDRQIIFTLSTAEQPHQIVKTAQTDYAFLAMPPASIEIVAEATRYQDADIVDILNHPKVLLYRESVILQPSYKVAMFFNTEWWKSADYPPKLNGDNVFGPTITDTPLRQIYYFGNNSRNGKKEIVYGLLASYDDEQFVSFWKEMELEINELRQVPLSQDIQPLQGPRKAPDAMIQMLREQLALVHFDNSLGISKIPKPLETVFMDWSQKPFSAGYHAWATHYDIDDVMQKIRKPSQLIDGIEANLYIVGSAYSNDQAWVEGAFCTSESVLTDFFGMPPLISEKDYPFICRCPRSKQS